MRENTDLFTLWRRLNQAPYHFPMTESFWEASMFHDTDHDGRALFSDLKTECSGHALIQYGHTAFGFDDSGEISDNIHHRVIRFLCFEEGYTDEGQQLLDQALEELGGDEKIWAFFHYFGMSACASHGKLHEKDGHIAALLIQNGFEVEHENVYYAKCLTEAVSPDSRVTLRWKECSAGGHREFAATADGCEIGWGQVHFLPQGDIAYLRWIYIDGTRQHQGLGSAVMRSLFSQLYEMGIRRFDTDTALDNRIAQAYYEKCGFSNEGITRSYHRA